MTNRVVESTRLKHTNLAAILEYINPSELYYKARDYSIAIGIVSYDSLARVIAIQDVPDLSPLNSLTNLEFGIDASLATISKRYRCTRRTL